MPIVKNDSQWWDSFRNGDEKAFSWIFNNYVQSLYQYGIRFVADEDLVKDSIQELFIKLYNNRSNLSATDNIQLYLFRALKNRLINNLSNKKDFISLSTSTLPFEVENSSDAELEDEEWSVTLRKLQLEKGMKNLTPRQREAIYLRYIKEMSIDEICTLLNLNQQSARNLIHRGIEKLRKELSLAIILLFLSFFIIH